VSATFFASLNGNFASVSNLPASPAVTLRSPALHVLSAPAGKAASKQVSKQAGKQGKRKKGKRKK